MAKSEAEKRRERLTAALRENLKRRKAQKRGQAGRSRDENAGSARDERPVGDGLSGSKSSD